MGAAVVAITVDPYVATNADVTLIERDMIIRTTLLLSESDFTFLSEFIDIF